MWGAVNEKEKTLLDNAEEDGVELISLLKKKSNLCKHNAIYFESLTYFWIFLFAIAPLAVLVDGYGFQLLNNLHTYIYSFEHGKEQFVAEQQKLKFYAEYIRVIAKQSSEFARKFKKRWSWQIAGLAKENLNTLTKPLHNYNAIRQTSFSNRNIAINTISAKWWEETADFICNYNPSKKWAKKVRQAALKWTWMEAHELVTELVIWRLESSIRYGTLNRLTIDWDNVIALDVTQPLINLVDEV